MDIREKLRLNAELVISELSPHSPQPLGYDTESVRWVDGFIERQRRREDATQALFDGLINIIGSYLGECIIRYYGGAWTTPPDSSPAVEFSPGNVVYPFAKVRKQFENGADNGDSIAGLFDTIGVIFKQHLRPGVPGTQPSEAPPSQLRPIKRVDKSDKDDGKSKH